ncbi:MAG TPA: cation diffusion facilitator family transporter [Nitrospirota bacterium]|nr:cation diffusion facilitator family transporter [Nitrospirota bacterium]
MERLGQVRRVLILTLLLNLLVSAAKIAAGYWFRSLGMVADGFHSLFDASSNVMGLAGVKMASKPPDEAHPYGHKKYESFAAMGVGGFLFLTCFEILSGAYKRLGDKNHTEVTAVAVLVIVLTICVNIFVSWYEARKGRELGSDFLIADSGHTKSDIFASFAVLAGLAAVKAGYPAADPVAAVVIAALIGRVGFKIVKSASGILVDAARIRAEDIVRICMGVPGVLRCHHVRSRGREDEIFMDLRVHVAPGLPIEEAHKIAHRVEEVIKKNIKNVTDVVVHIEPESKGEN